MVKAQEQETETETETETEGGFRFLSLFVFLLWGLDLNAFYIWFCQLVRSLSSYMGRNLKLYSFHRPNCFFFYISEIITVVLLFTFS